MPPRATTRPQTQAYLYGSSIHATGVGDGEFYLTVVGRPTRDLEPRETSTEWSQIRFTQIRTYTQLSPGEVLPIQASVEGITDGSLKVSLRLTDAKGQVLAQQDATLFAEFQSGLLVPPNVASMEYQLRALVYDPATLNPIPNIDGEEQPVLLTIATR